MTYEGPGMMTRSEVKRSVKEGKGKLATPIFVVKSKSNRMSVGEKEEERRGEKTNQGRGEKHTASHEVRKLLLNLEYRQAHRQRHSLTSNLAAGTILLDLRMRRMAFRK